MKNIEKHKDNAAKVKALKDSGLTVRVRHKRFPVVVSSKQNGHKISGADSCNPTVREHIFPQSFSMPNQRIFVRLTNEPIDASQCRKYTELGLGLDPAGGATTVEVYRAGDKQGEVEPLITTESVCCDLDPFNRATGFNIAINRAVGKLRKKGICS